MEIEYKKVKTIGNVIVGTTAPQEPIYFENGTLPFLRASDLGAIKKSMNFTKVKDFVTESAVKEKGLTKVTSGSVVFPKSGASVLTNNCAILGIDAYLVNHLAAIEVNEEIVPKEWIYFYLNSIDFATLVDDPSYPSLQQSKIENLKIPFPKGVDLKIKSEEIKSKLEKVEQMRQAALHQKEAVEALQGALLREVFPFKEGDELPKGWKWEKLEKIFEEVKNQVQPNEEEFKSLPFVGLENVISHTREYTDEEYNPPASTCFKFDENNILYGKLRPYLNKVFLPISKGKSSMELIPLKTKNNYSREFLAAVLQSEAVIGDTVKFSTGGRMPRADLKKLKRLEIAIPSDVNVCNKLGLTVSNKIKEIIDLNKKAKKQVEAIEALPAAILREVFEFKTN